MADPTSRWLTKRPAGVSNSTTHRKNPDPTRSLSTVPTLPPSRCEVNPTPNTVNCDRGFVQPAEAIDGAAVNGNVTELVVAGMAHGQARDRDRRQFDLHQPVKDLGGGDHSTP